MKVEVVVRYNNNLTITYDNSTIIGSMTIGNELYSPQGAPEFEVVMPYGSIKVFDKGSEVYNAILNNTLINESYETEDDFIVKVDIYLDSSHLGTFEATIDYSFLERIICFELSNNLSNWEKYKYSGFTFFDWRLSKCIKGVDNRLVPYDLSYPKTELEERLKDYITGYELCNILILETQKYEKNTSFKIDDSVVDYLEKINICAPNLEVSNLLEAWNHFCSITFTCLYKNSSNQIEIIRVC